MGKEVSLAERFISTVNMDKELKNAGDIGDFLQKNQKYMLTGRLSDHLNSLLAKKSLQVADVVKHSYLEKGYVYQIFSGRKMPSRDKLVAIAFGLGLSDDETQEMLKVAGYKELYVKNARDAVIRFSLQNKMPIYKANELLEQYGFQLLGNVGDCEKKSVNIL